MVVTFGVAVEECKPNSSDVLSCRVNEVDLNFWCCQFEHKQLSFLDAGVITMLDEGGICRFFFFKEQVYYFHTSAHSANRSSNTFNDIC